MKDSLSLPHTNVDPITEGALKKLFVKRPHILLVALFAASALIVAGCGGDDGGGDASTAAVESETTAVAGDAEERDAENGEGEGGTDGDTGQPLAEKDFVATVTEICERTTQEALAAGLGEPFTPADSQDEQALAAKIVDRFNKFREILKPAFAELHEIAAPAASRGDFAEFIATNERLMELGERVMADYAKDPGLTISEADMQAQQRLKQKQERLNRKLGLPESCFDNTPS